MPFAGRDRARCWATLGATPFVAASLAVATVVVAPATAAEDATAHGYDGDGSPEDSIGGADAVWTGTEAYGAGAGSAPGDQSFEFDGASFLTAGGPDTGNYGTDDFTIALSVRITAPGVFALVSKRAGCTAGVTFLDLRANRNGPGVLAELQDAANPALQLDNPTPVDDGAYHSVMFRRTGTLLLLAVDGIVTTTTSNGVIDLDIPDPLRFGTSGCVGFDGTQNLIGNLDGIAVAPGGPLPPLPSTTTTTAPPGTTTTALATSTTSTATGPPSPSASTTTPPRATATTAPSAPTTSATPSAAAPSSPRRPSTTLVRGRGSVPTTTRPAGPTTVTTAPVTTTTEKAAPPSTGDRPGPPGSDDVAGAPTAPAERGPSVGRDGTSARLGAAEQFIAALATPEAVGFELGDIARSLWLVMLLLALLRLPVTIVNRTLEVHADEISATAARWRQRLAARGIDGRLSTVPLAGQVAAVGLAGASLYAVIQPGLRLDRSSMALVLGVLTALLAQTSVSALSQIRYIHRSAAIAGVLRLFPAFALIAAASVAVSRVIDLQPGLLLGPLATVVFLAPPSTAVLGRTMAVTYSNIALASLVAWTTRGVAVDAAGHLGPFLADLVGVAWTTTAIVGIQALVFNMVPIDIFHGRYVMRWSTLAWGALAVTGGFALVHVVLRQTDTAAAYADRTTYLGMLFAIYLLLALTFRAVVSWIAVNRPAAAAALPD